MEWQHPVFQEMLQLGCTDQMKVNLAFQAYMKLCEVHKLCNVEYFYDKELDTIYLSSRGKKEQELHVPISTWKPLSPAMLHSIRNTLLRTNPNSSVTILIRTPDTSLLPYKLTEGLCPPVNPESSKEKKALQEKLQCIQSELNKRKLELFQEAKRKRFLSTKPEDNKDLGRYESDQVSVKEESVNSNNIGDTLV